AHQHREQGRLRPPGVQRRRAGLQRRRPAVPDQPHLGSVRLQGGRHAAVHLQRRGAPARARPVLSAGPTRGTLPLPAMRFRQHQDAAQAASRRLLGLFALVLLVLVVAVNAVLALVYRITLPWTEGFPNYFFETNTALVL